MILSDLKEVETLVQTFKSDEYIVPGFLKLSLKKIDQIKQEIELLEELNIPVPSASKSSDLIQIPENIHPQEYDSAKAPKHAEQHPLMEIEETSSTISSPEVETKHASIDQKSPVNQPIATPPPSDEKQDQPHPDHKHKPHGTTLGETIVTEKTSVLDKIKSSHGDQETMRVTGNPVDDIKKAIGLNDRFLFQRELFDGNNGLMDQTIDQLNQLSNYREAEQFIQSNFNWDHDDESVMSFMGILKRRFIS